ncbi:MAG: T9SS type A sorting domain-containing protein [Saprospiraceae bacterium]|nr:T9SS type A sorting domain-containing protein [Saprospiraceae bacterium]MBP6565986.1 T9SS type A sorting domain-containing protein [Saprospiraceae bacterium]
MKYLTIFLISALLCNDAYAQCPPGNITFSSQTSIDNFSLDYPGCTVISGNLTIQSNNITNLNGLSPITNITGSLRFNNADMLSDISGLSNLTMVGLDVRITNCGLITSLTGLTSLTSVGGDFNIASNPNLTSLEGITSLSSVGGNFILSANASLNQLANAQNPTMVNGNITINNNDALINLAGFENIQNNGGSLVISNNLLLTNLSGLTGLNSILNLDIFTNANLQDFTGLSGLTTINGNVTINNNPSLLHFNGLENLTNIVGSLSVTSNSSLIDLVGVDDLHTIGQSLNISVNSSLENLSGLTGLVSVGSFFQIGGNPMLQSLTSLTNLTNVNGQLLLSQNNSLVSLSGLDNIDHLTLGGVFISDSPLLSECDVASICAYIAVENNSTTFSQNATGCNSELQVENACLGILPLEWLSFEVVQKSDNVLLIWQTQHEVNNNFFEVEKSQDGLLFTPIAKITATDDQTQSFEYQYTDMASGYGNMYYRIKQVDFDGKYSYSKIIAIAVTLSKTIIYPNPSSEILLLKTGNNMANFLVKDIFGIVQISGTFSGHPIDISTLKSGVYIMEIGTQKYFFTKM